MKIVDEIETQTTQTTTTTTTTTKRRRTKEQEGREAIVKGSELNDFVLPRVSFIDYFKTKRII